MIRVFNGEATKADVGKLCYFWDGDEDYSKQIGLLTMIRTENCIFKYVLANSVCFAHCRKLTKEEKDWLEKTPNRMYYADFSDNCEKLKKKQRMTCKKYCPVWNDIDKDCEIYGEHHFTPRTCPHYNKELKNE